MSSDSFLINTNRGSVVDEESLVQALQSGKLAGAYLDVTEEEPLPTAHPLRRLPNVLVTPHFGANSEEALIDLRQRSLHSLLCGPVFKRRTSDRRLHQQSQTTRQMIQRRHKAVG
jgi:D-3-phosphoglycerate dehydrogenase / 2-oxoglutarate reductase